MDEHVVQSEDSVASENGQILHQNNDVFVDNCREVGAEGSQLNGQKRDDINDKVRLQIMTPDTGSIRDQNSVNVESDEESRDDVNHKDQIQAVGKNPRVGAATVECPQESVHKKRQGNRESDK